MAWRKESIVSQRLEFVTLASAEGANIRALCRRFRISPPTGYLWIERHRALGDGGLVDRSRRPHRSPDRCDAATEAAVLGVRAEHPVWGARKIRAVLETRGMVAPAVSTVHSSERVMRPRSLVHTPDDRPNGVEFEIFMTSASSFGTRTIGTTGPKVSSNTSSDWCGTKSTVIGGSTAPLRPGS